ncbi:MAG: CHAT domain-containing tetratricopeptide repeat protein [Fimbriimonadales bacterium]
MTESSAINAPSTAKAREILRRSGPLAGTNRSFFERVVELAGSDPAAARKLAARWGAFFELGDDPAYAVRARAVGERIAGKWQTAGESFVESGALAKASRDRAVFSIGAVDSFARSGDVARAVAIGRRIVTSLNTVGDREQAGRVHLNMGNALLFVDDYKRAAEHYAKAAELLRDSEFKRDWAAAELGVSGSELFGGSVTKAAQHARAASQLFEELGDSHFADLAKLNLAHCFTLHGKGDEAVALLLELGPRIAGSPSDSARKEEFLGDAYLRLNLYEEALDAYSEAMRRSSLRHLPINLANTHYGKGQAHVALGDPAAAKRHLSKAAEMYLALGNYVWAGAAMSAVSELERSELSRRKSEEAIALLRRAKSTFHLAQALIRHSERFGSAEGLADAEKIIEVRGYPFLSWRIDAARARNAKGVDRLGHLRRMFESMMTERLLTRSTASRAAFLRDKSNALSDYLSELLTSDPPNVDEALDVVTRSRSIALIDEMLTANPEGFSPEYLAVLDELRTLIAEESAEDSGGARRGASGTQRLNHLCRAVLERDFSPKHYTDSKREIASVADTAVFLDARDSVHSLFKGQSIRLGVTGRELHEIVRRAEFELLSPMVGIQDTKGVALEMDAIRKLVIEPLLAIGRPARIAPDGALWGLPWSVLLEEEPVVLANPAFPAWTLNKPIGRVVVWANDPGDLPHVEAEAQAVRDYFPNAEICRTREAALASLDDDIDLLHVASHATVRFENPLYSSIELSDGPLLGIEVARSGGSARLVTLSACDTGRVSLRLKTEPDGLVRAFLALGADAVVASLWPFDDEGAWRMMKAYYQSVSEGADVRDALSGARTAVRAWREHPYYWASLSLFGGCGRKCRK